MEHDDLTALLVRAAEEFPVDGPDADLGRRVSRRRRQRSAAGIVAVAVLAGVVGVGAVMVGSAGHLPAPQPAGKASVTATAGAHGCPTGLWRLTSVSTTGGAIAVPAAIQATLTISASGRAQLKDGINTLTATATCTPTSLELTSVGTTYVLYDGRDPVQVQVIRAFRLLAYGNAEGTTTAVPSHAVIHGVGSTLELEASGSTMTFQRVG